MLARVIMVPSLNDIIIVSKTVTLSADSLVAAPGAVTAIKSPAIAAASGM
jgi:hypothetical protein